MYTINLDQGLYYLFDIKQYKIFESLSSDNALEFQPGEWHMEISGLDNLRFRMYLAGLDKKNTLQLESNVLQSYIQDEDLGTILESTKLGYYLLIHEDDIHLWFKFIYDDTCDLSRDVTDIYIEFSEYNPQHEYILIDDMVFDCRVELVDGSYDIVYSVLLVHLDNDVITCLTVHNPTDRGRYMRKLQNN